MGALAGVILLFACIARESRSAPSPKSAQHAPAGGVLTGSTALGDWRTDAPGVRRHLTLADLPPPYATPSVDNGPRVVTRPENAWPKVPPGFKVDLFVTGLDNPRLIRAAPNGDLFLAESAPGRIRVLRAAAGASKAATNRVYASGLNKPFGIAFYPPGPHPRYLYVGDTDQVLRFPYQSGDLQARGAPQVIVPDIPSGGRLRGGGHWTRDVAFTNDGKKMLVSVGSHSNDNENPNESEVRRSDILEYNPDGTGFRIYASGIRNAVGIAIHPQTGELWASVNERDVLGDNLVPDYVTRVRDSGFYGWPWFYMGPHQDPRHPGAHPELHNKVLTPDLLLESHMASLEMTFYPPTARVPGQPFPTAYRGVAFAAQHGSWNRRRRVGYKIISVPVRNGKPTGEYDDFMTGFVTSDGEVWGRPVGVTVAMDGALIVTDDGSDSVWRVSYHG
jgi:glucose/arabinose dehydrogenase